MMQHGRFGHAAYGLRHQAPEHLSRHLQALHLSSKGVMRFFVGVTMYGMLAYILASLAIAYITEDWLWIVFCTICYLALFAGGLWLCQSRRHVSYNHC